ncbi:MAG: GerMN domain-containing protein [Nitrospirae bacterium]|nr:GerMN domain-containing protein [Nitrospirota bacterium]
MKSSRRIKSKTSSWTYLSAALVLFIIGAVASYFYFKPRLALENPFKDIETQKSEIKPLEKQDKTAEDTGLSVEEEKEPVNGDVLAAVENAIKKNLKSYDVLLLDIYKDKEGTVYIDLSSEVKKNFQGDVLEEYGIIAGLYRSIKEKIPDSTAMKILIDGKEADSLGGHIDISDIIGEKIAGG